MDISVLVTNHNYGRYVGRALRSILNQSLSKKSYEVIVVDDASSDDSRNVIDVYKSQCKTIYLEQNVGLSAACNIGIGKSTGRYVVRLDSDDYVHADFLQTLMLGFELHGKDCEAVSTDYYRVDQSGAFLSYGSQETEPIACAIGFKIDALETLGFYSNDLRINEEIDLRNRFLEEEYRQVNINLPLYRYVQHSASLSRKVPI